MDNIEVGEILTVMDENNREQEIEVLDLMTVDNTEYAAVRIAEDNQEDSEEDLKVYLLRIEEDELCVIDNDEEFEKVSTAFIEAREDLE
ncbi:MULTISPECIES: DUF1292 domain-containing protein [Bacillaceae]|uniref:DUF1292 domain-containing protein n=1 Tax=Bacillaceae TaxID=186817 RepID=UPI0006AFE1A6|nr:MULTISPECIES: DUF1292 domain-containing protein [Bacillaceae]ALC87816.1 cyclopropane-fatty-acyl-phospholipid synthase [Bacillus sp. FJAT-22090]KQL35331.1 cyclopropane-fatty-acyl-phospholipid synthase [Psychrobacillus sp. FJAT-21963]